MMAGKPSRAQLIRYWTLKRYLEYCRKYCKKELGCWEESYYVPEIMLKVCPHENIKKVIVLLNNISKNYGPLAFALTAKEYDEVMRIVEEKMKEKVSEYEEPYKLD